MQSLRVFARVENVYIVKARHSLLAPARSVLLIQEYSTDEVSVYGAPYVRCSTCAHVYVSKRPTAAALERFYRKSTSYASTYVDANLAQRRIEQIAKPKLDWVLDCYKLLHKGCKPEYILDVGAGGALCQSLR